MFARAPLRLAVVAILAALVLVLAAFRYRSPSSKPATAPAAEFSGERARATLARILAHGAPHPTGSDEASRVRERIVGELSHLGYAPRVQRSFACGRHGACAFVANVIAELHGSASTGAVLVSAHYDSVGAGAGANDDGTGVAAVLEIARALTATTPLAHSVLFVLTDAEEEGLLGARAFAENDPDMARVRAAVNLDARGSRGPATLFEISGNGDIVRALASAIPRPVTSSLFFSIYRRMPNDTDFSVWRLRARGANFAFLGDISNYHTALDRFDTTSSGTMQQEGEGALGMIRALADARDEGTRETRPAAPPTETNAVWFDVLAAHVVRWDGVWTTPLACAGVALVALAIALQIRGGRTRIARAVFGIGLLPVATAGAALIGFAIVRALTSMGITPAPWTANAPWIVAATCVAGVAVATFAIAPFARAEDHGGPREPARGLGLWSGTWLFFAIAGAVSAWAAPGASYLFIVPSIAAGLAGIAGVRLEPYRALMLMCAVPLVVCLLLFSPILILLYDAIGLPGTPLCAGLTALLTSALGPLIVWMPSSARTRTAAALASLALALCTIAAGSAPFSAEVPSRANVLVEQDEVRARIVVDATWSGRSWGVVPPAMQAAMGSDAHDVPHWPWAPYTVLAADTPRSAAEAPTLKVLATEDRSGRREMQLRLVSGRSARTLTLLVSPEADARILRVHESLYADAPLATGWHGVRVTGVPADGVTIVVEAAGAPIELTVLDETPGAPSAAHVTSARPETATPTQRGDITILSRKVRL
jgi:hypothetical protein